MTQSPPRLASITVLLVVVLAVSGWTSLATGHLEWLMLPATLGVCGLSGWLGVCCWSLVTRSKRELDAIAALLLGYFLLSVILFLGTAVLHLDLLLSAGVVVA